MTTGYKGFNKQAFARTASTTLAEHITEVEPAFMRNFKFLGLLESAGLITYNHSGEGTDWPVQYRIHNVEGNTGEDPRRFERANLWKTAAVEYRGYQATDMMYLKEFESNKGPQGIIKVFDNMTERIDKSVRQSLGTQFFIDGSKAENAKLWEGMETMFGATQTINSTLSGAVARAANQADLVAYPASTYATLNTTLANYGGDQESGQTWPDGIADPEFDFWSPVIGIWNSTNSEIASGSNLFSDQGEAAMRYAIMSQMRNDDLEDQLTQFFLARNLYRQFKNAQDDRQEIQVASNYTVKAIGFADVLNFDGVEVTWEASVPVNRGYGLALQNTELRCMQGQLLTPEGPEWDIHTQAFLAVVYTLSNFKYKSPRNYVKLCKHDDLAA